MAYMRANEPLQAPTHKIPAGLIFETNVLSADWLAETGMADFIAKEEALRSLSDGRATSIPYVVFIPDAPVDGDDADKLARTAG